MTLEEVQKALWPNSTLPMPERYKIAWQVLGCPETLDGCREHAKCWLTHRTVEGAITLPDWLKHIEPHRFNSDACGEMHARWAISQAMAELHLWMKEHRLDKAMSACKRLQQDDLRTYPLHAMNYANGRVIQCYLLIHEGNPETAKRIIANTLSEYRDAMASIVPMKFPWHFYETRNGWEPMAEMMVLAKRLQMFTIELPAWCTPAPQVNPWAKTLSIARNLL